MVWRGWSEKTSAPRSRAGARASSVVAPLDVADEAKRRGRGRDRRARVRRSRRRERRAAPLERAGQASRARSRPASSTGTPTRSAAAAIDRPALPAPITASGNSRSLRVERGGAGEVSFQFSHRRYQTAWVGSCWSGRLAWSTPSGSRPPRIIGSGWGRRRTRGWCPKRPRCDTAGRRRSNWRLSGAYRH